MAGGPQADEATWMGPVGNASFCGDSEGSREELKGLIAQRQQFLQKFSNSRFAPRARQEIVDAEAQLNRRLSPEGSGRIRRN